MRKLSVLLPIYNGEQTIERCIESVLCQNYKNIELICINDGSTDKSGEICKSYAKQDGRVKIYEKKNGGVASARNYGMKFASGEYLTCIDQDDWIESEMYLKIINSMENEKADLGVCGFCKEYENGNIVQMENSDIIPEIISDADDFIRFAFYREQYRNYGAYVWNKIFSLKIIKDNEIVFDKKLRRGDDVLFYTLYSLKSQRCIYLDDRFYHYSVSNKSTSNNRDYGNINVLEDILEAYEMAIKKIEDSKVVSRETTDYLKCFEVYHASLLLEIVVNSYDVERQKYYRGIIKKYLEEYTSQNKHYPGRIVRLNNLMEIEQH